MMQHDFHCWAYEGEQHRKMIERRNKRDLAMIQRERRSGGRFLRSALA